MSAAAADPSAMLAGLRWLAVGLAALPLAGLGLALVFMMLGDRRK